MAGAAGRSGRRPKPTAKKLLAGNPGKRALNQAEPDFELVLNIDCPDWMGDNGRMLWEAVAPQLCKERILAATDIQNLEVYCSAYDQFRMAQADIKEATAMMASYGGMLGLDPSSRQRMMGTGKKKQSDNPFAGVING